MKTPTIAQAKKYFEKAKTIRVTNAKTIIEVNTSLFEKSDIGGINEVLNGNYLMTNGYYHCVFCPSSGYAEIITSK